MFYHNVIFSLTLHSQKIHQVHSQIWKILIQLIHQQEILTSLIVIHKVKCLLSPPMKIKFLALTKTNQVYN
jgi:hypothetical protein